MPYSVQWKNGGTSYGSTEVDFCKKNNINVYTPLFYLDSLIKYAGESGVTFEKNDFIYSLEENPQNQERFKKYEKKFPTEEGKPEIAMVHSIGHIGVLYYDGKDKFYIDTGGIINESESSDLPKELKELAWQNKAWLEDKIKNENYKYIRTNCLSGVGGYKLLQHENEGGLTLENIHNISLNNPISEKEKDICNMSKLTMALEEDNSAKKCMPTSMALVAMFKQQGKLDLNNVIQGFNTEKILTQSKEGNPDMLDDNYSILDFKIEDEESHKLSDNWDDWLKDELPKIKMQENQASNNFLSNFVNKIKNSFSR